MDNFTIIMWVSTGILFASIIFYLIHSPIDEITLGDIILLIVIGSILGYMLPVILILVIIFVLLFSIFDITIYKRK